MADTRTLLVLLEQHERARDEAIARHQRLLRAADAAAAQATQLHGYRRDYEQRWSTQFRQECQIEILRSYHSFAQRLAQAVEQQDSAAEFAAQQIEAGVIALREAELRCASVRKLIERRTHEQRQGEERREQKQTDEQAARAGWDRRHNADSPLT
ncbi:MAG TPA: flagellar export protein FliJ [Burkholderiaceae bacterium]|jgi:flagellar FliJ protein